MKAMQPKGNNKSSGTQRTAGKSYYDLEETGAETVPENCFRLENNIIGALAFAAKNNKQNSRL